MKRHGGLVGNFTLPFASMITLYDSKKTVAFCNQNGIDLHPLRRFRNALLKKGVSLPGALLEIPEERRNLFEKNIELQVLDVVERHDSKQDGATKLVFQCREDGARIEAVILRIASGRTSLCISSQVGCAANCRFCATGKLGFVRDLSAAEMLDQVMLSRRLLREEDRDLRNVVVMGMGEPLHNEANLFQCMERLRDPRYFNFSENHLMVSTVGIPDAMQRFVEQFPEIRLALSLHCARQEVRAKLMPVGQIQTLEKLRSVLLKMGKNCSPMVEYLLLKGVNDSSEDLQALIDFLDGIDAHVNLIQFNPHSGAEFEPVSDDARADFADALKRAGLTVTLRYSLGNDIAAACGQLAGKKKTGES